MKNLNVFYHGLTNYGSCWDLEDDELAVLMVPLSLEDMKVRLIDYVYLEVDEEFDYFKFLEYVKNSLDEKTHYIYGYTSRLHFLPEFESNILGEEYDLAVSLNPSRVLNDWEDMKKIWQKRKESRIKQEKEDEKKKEKRREAQRKYREKKKEYEEYLELKKKWENKTKPKEPEIKMTSFEKFSKDFKKK